MLLPQALLPASPAVDAESFTPRLTRTSVLFAHVIVKRFGLGSGFTRPLPQTMTRLSSRPLNGAGLPGSMDTPGVQREGFDRGGMGRSAIPSCSFATAQDYLSLVSQ